MAIWSVIKMIKMKNKLLRNHRQLQHLWEIIARYWKMLEEYKILYTSVNATKMLPEFSCDLSEVDWESRKQLRKSSSKSKILNQIQNDDSVVLQQLVSSSERARIHVECSIGINAPLSVTVSPPTWTHQKHWINIASLWYHPATHDSLSNMYLI